MVGLVGTGGGCGRSALQVWWHEQPEWAAQRAVLQFRFASAVALAATPIRALAPHILPSAFGPCPNHWEAGFLQKRDMPAESPC